MAIETPNYKLIIKEESFEIRSYPEINTIEVKDYYSLGDSGFNMLFDYISGRNKKSMKLSMTAPVINTLIESKSKMSFIVPKKYTLEEIPEPLVDKLQINVIPARIIGVLTFSGNVNRQKIEEESNKLLKWLDTKKIKVKGEIQLARFNPPFIPGIFKHNEIWQAIEYKG